MRDRVNEGRQIFQPRVDVSCDEIYFVRSCRRVCRKIVVDDGDKICTLACWCASGDLVHRRSAKMVLASDRASARRSGPCVARDHQIVRSPRAVFGVRTPTATRRSHSGESRELYATARRVPARRGSYAWRSNAHHDVEMLHLAVSHLLVVWSFLRRPSCSAKP